MGTRLAAGALCVILGAFAGPARALDPMLMFLFSAAREVISAAARAEKSPFIPAPAPVTPSTRYPGTSVEPADMRRLIDECFAYLSDAQRREIFESLHSQLDGARTANESIFSATAAEMSSVSAP